MCALTNAFPVRKSDVFKKILKVILKKRMNNTNSVV